ncbi:MAG: hypothetical protein HRT90_03505 [Candidatus Margulisbacteria bacterium]|nr:hypothetical protein [Candidatus Margulisiibacteriota bacterium]
MIKTAHIQNLHHLLSLLDSAVSWLNRSYTQCQKVGIKPTYTPEEYDAFENLTSRFSRVCDILIQKVFRSIDSVELEEKGSLIDIMNRAHKRHLFENVNEVYEMKSLRNEVAHEYKLEDLKEIFKSVLTFTPKLLVIVQTTKDYCSRYKTLS